MERVPCCASRDVGSRDTRATRWRTITAVSRFVFEYLVILQQQVCAHVRYSAGLKLQIPKLSHAKLLSRCARQTPRAGSPPSTLPYLPQVGLSLTARLDRTQSKPFRTHWVVCSTATHGHVLDAGSSRCHRLSTDPSGGAHEDWNAAVRAALHAIYWPCWESHNDLYLNAVSRGEAHAGDVGTGRSNCVDLFLDATRSRLSNRWILTEYLQVQRA